MELSFGMEVVCTHMCIDTRIGYESVKTVFEMLKHEGERRCSEALRRHRRQHVYRAGINMLVRKNDRLDESFPTGRITCPMCFYTHEHSAMYNVQCTMYNVQWYGGRWATCEPVRITGFERCSNMNESADAVYAIVSVPWMITNPSYRS